jgi:signal transduction histidine kinase
MHDGVQGHLIALSQQLELLGRVAESNPTRAVELAHEGRESARKAADELRFLVQRLRTPAIQDGFASALRHFAHTVTSRCGLELEFRVTGDEVALEPDTENALFRIAQEALTNVIKHAEATGVTIEVSYSPDEVKLTLEDDGRGLDEARADGVGLESIRTRARERGGKATVEGATRGTRVVAIVPNVKRI